MQLKHLTKACALALGAAFGSLAIAGSGEVVLIHTGDIHLDSPLKGLSGQQGAAAERIRTAARVAFDNLVSQAIEEQVAFVIIAGDLYDGDWRDYQTGLFFVRQMGRLAQAGIPVFLLYGNHDAESQITRRLVLPCFELGHVAIIHILEIVHERRHPRARPSCARVAASMPVTGSWVSPCPSARSRKSRLV